MNVALLAPEHTQQIGCTTGLISEGRHLSALWIQPAGMTCTLWVLVEGKQ